MEMRPLVEIGRKIEEIRLAKGMSRKELSLKSDVSVSTIRSFEVRGSDIGAIKFIRICLALEIEDPDDIIYIQTEQN